MGVLVKGELSRTRLALNRLLYCWLFILEFGKRIAEVILSDLIGGVFNGIDMSAMGATQRLGSGHVLLNRPALFTGELSLCYGLTNSRQVSLLERFRRDA